MHGPIIEPQTYLLAAPSSGRPCWRPFWWLAGSKYSSQLWSDAATGVVTTIVSKPPFPAPSLLRCPSVCHLQGASAIRQREQLYHLSPSGGIFRSRMLAALTAIRLCAPWVDPFRVLSSSNPSSVGHGARAVAQPSMLEEAMAAAVPLCKVASTLPIQCSRLVRLVSIDGYACVGGECGKQHSLRAGFLCCAPKFGVAEDAEFGATLSVL